MTLGYLRLTLRFHGCRSLKEKRSYLKPILLQVRKEFNVSAVESDYQDIWQSAEISLATVGNGSAEIERRFTGVPEWIERRWPDVHVTLEAMEIIQ